MSYASPYKAYEHANKTKSQEEQILMLYSGAICYVQQARKAAEENKHPARYELIEKAIKIIRGLQGCINPDIDEKVAYALQKYYESLEILLVSIQCEDNKTDLCDQVIKNLKIIKEVWEKAHRLSPANNDKEEGEEEGEEEENITERSAQPTNYEKQNLVI